MKSNFEKTLNFAKRRDLVSKITAYGSILVLIIFIPIAVLLSVYNKVYEYGWLIVLFPVVAVFLAAFGFIYLFFAMNYRNKLIKTFNYSDAPGYLQHLSNEKYRFLVLDIFIAGIYNYFYEKNKVKLVEIDNIETVNDDVLYSKELILLSFFRNTVYYKDGHFRRIPYVFLGTKKNKNEKKKYPVVDISAKYLDLWNEEHCDKNLLKQKCKKIEADFKSKHSKYEIMEDRTVIVGEAGVIELFTKFINADKVLNVFKILFLIVAVCLIIAQVLFRKFASGYVSDIDAICMFYFEAISVLLLLFEMTEGKADRYLY